MSSRRSKPVVPFPTETSLIECVGMTDYQLIFGNHFCCIYFTERQVAMDLSIPPATGQERPQLPQHRHLEIGHTLPSQIQD
jgi:hypothetical protein